MYNDGLCRPSHRSPAVTVTGWGIFNLFRIIIRQGVQLPSPAATGDPQHEEHGGDEEGRPVLLRVPQGVHTLAAHIPHPGPGTGVRTWGVWSGWEKKTTTNDKLSTVITVF